VRILVDRWRLLPNTAMYDIAAVFVWLGLGNLVSVMFPYRPISLRARLKARPTWIRWGLRQAVPYALYYLGAPLLLTFPSVVIHVLEPFGPRRLLYYPVVSLANALVGWLVGLWLATGKIWVKGFVLTGVVTRSAPDAGVRIRFDGMEPPDKENLRLFLRYVQETTRASKSESSYLQLLK